MLPKVNIVCARQTAFERVRDIRRSRSFLSDLFQPATQKDERHGDAALLTFLVTLSGITMAGIGSAFWGVTAGAVALVVQQWRLQGAR